MSPPKVRPGTSHDGQSVFPTTPGSVSNRTRERKRNRKCISCLRCHRLKVRCDRKSPCTRCTTSRRPIKCIYENTSENQDETETRLPEHKEGEDAAVTHEQRRALFEEFLDWNVPPDQVIRANYQNAELTDFLEVEELSASSSFEFMTPGLGDSPYSESLEDPILQNIGQQQTSSPRDGFSYNPTNDIVEQYRMGYLDPFEQTNQLVDSTSLHPELAGFWAGQDYTGLSWLAQASMIPEGDDQLSFRPNFSTSAKDDNG